MHCVYVAIAGSNYWKSAATIFNRGLPEIEGMHEGALVLETESESHTYGDLDSGIYIPGRPEGLYLEFCCEDEDFNDILYKFKQEFPDFTITFHNPVTKVTWVLQDIIVRIPTPGMQVEVPKERTLGDILREKLSVPSEDRSKI